MNIELKKVISASRRIDMVGNAPDQFVDILNQKCPPEKTHTLVIWTKNPANIFTYRPLLNKIQQYEQLFFHYTITGMGGSKLEPGIPAPEDSINWLPKLVDLAGDPRRIRFRFDPVVHLKFPDGSIYCNLPWFEKLAPYIKKAGVENISISWMSVYRKVLARLKRAGISAIDISQQDWEQDYSAIMDVAGKYNFSMHGCCVPGMPRSRCIDGELLMNLHPSKALCSKRKAKGQRTVCGCTESWDIGWYNKCNFGCIYCYANPVELESRENS